MGVMMIHMRSVWLTFIFHVDICFFHLFIQTHSVADYPWKDFKGINQDSETDTYHQTTQVHEEAETRLWWSYSHAVPGQPRDVSSYFVAPWESLLLHFLKQVFGKKPSPSACLSLEMQSRIPASPEIFVVTFLLNEIPSCLHFLLGQTVVEHQDVSEHSLSSASTLFQRAITALFSCQVTTAQQWIKARLPKEKCS